MPGRSGSAWWAALVLLAGARVAIAVAAYAGAGDHIHALPAWHRHGLEGDANGFYAATREFMASWNRMPRSLFALAAMAALAGVFLLVRAWRRRPERRWWLAPAALLGFGLLVCLAIHWMRPSGAAVLGWSLVWAVVLLPYRIAFGLDRSAAWNVGFVLSLVVVAATVPAVAYLARHATGRRLAGLVAALAWTGWPLLVGVIAGHRAWANGQWDVDVGLHLYDEPLSTLLVTAGAALILSPRLTALRLSLAGCALSFATAVKVSNAIPAVVALVVVWMRGREREALPYALGAVSFAPVVVAYWPLSYPTLYDNPKSWPRDPFDVGHVVSSWTHSSIFTPRTLAVILPLALVGVAAVRQPWPLALVACFLLVNPVFYSFYANTAEHPRFLYASLPELFTLWAGGVLALGSLVSQRRLAPSPEP